MELDQLKELLDRISRNASLEDDLRILSKWLMEGRITAVSGNQAVAIGGDVNDVVIVIGDNNIVYKGADADVVRKVIQEILSSRQLPGLLTHSEFVARTESSAILGHHSPLVGRKALIGDFHVILGGEVGLLVLHGPGGIGKTRLLVALREFLPEGAQLWCVRTEAQSIDAELYKLDTPGRHVIVVDDAHRFTALPQLREVLVNPRFSGHTTVILVTRSVFKDSIIRLLAPPITVPLREIEVQPLTSVEIDELIRQEPFSIVEEYVRHAILRIADGNPLFAGSAALLAQRGGSLEGFTGEQLLVHYLHELIQDLADASYGGDYVAFIEILAGLGTVDLENQALQERICDVIGINANQRDHMIGRLVGAGLLDRYGTRIRISSEVVADHILTQHFFSPTEKLADYEAQVLKPFFAIQPKEILRHLARAETKTESTEAGLVLGQKLQELLRIVRDGSSQDRLAILSWLDEVAYLRPDDTLAMLAAIIEGPERADEDYQDRAWGNVSITHAMVLSSAVDLLEHTIYRGSLQGALRFLYQLAIYQKAVGVYEPVRLKAQKKLQELAEFKPHKPFGVQIALLDAARAWVQQSDGDDLRWILEVVRPTLKMEYMSAENDPTDPHKILIKQGLLPMAAPLRRLREQAIDIVFEAYHRARDLANRLMVVRTLQEALPRFMPNVKIPPEMYTWLSPDWEQIAKFASEVILPSSELPVMDIVEGWVDDRNRYGGSFPEELELLGARLRKHDQYQLYRLLVGWRRWDHGEVDDWREAEARRKQATDALLERIAPDTIDDMIGSLDLIARQAHEAREDGLAYLNLLLRRLGELDPASASHLIGRSIKEDLSLKMHLGEVLAGLRNGSPNLAWEHASRWLDSEDPILWQDIAAALRYASWDRLPERDWNMIDQLVRKGDKRVNLHIIGYTWRFAAFNNDLAVGILKEAAGSGDEAILNYIAQMLCFPNDARNGWAIEIKESADYLEIVRNFERLPRLDHDAEEALSRIGEYDPMDLIDLIERRVEILVSRPAGAEDYQAVPYRLSTAFDSIRTSTKYLDVLRRVRDWLLRDQAIFRFLAAEVLEGVSGGLGAPLFRILIEWVDSGDSAKLQSVARVLYKFNSGPLFYSLCREIILRADDQTILDSLSAAIHTTPGMVSGPMSNFSKQRLSEVAGWTQDEDFRVRRFGQRMIQELQRVIEREEAEERYEERYGYD